MRVIAILVISLIVRPVAARAQEPASTASPGPQTLTIQNVACAAPCQRGGRVVLSEHEMVFKAGKKGRIVVPFARIRGVQTYLGVKQDAPIPDPGAGWVWGFVKHKKAGFVFDYTNERGGTMGLVLLTDVKDGPTLREWLSRFDVPTSDLAPMPAPAKAP